VLINAICFVSVARDRAAIREVAVKIINPGSDKLATVEACMEYVHKTLMDNSSATIAEMPFWTRLNYGWNPRRVGPGTVLAHGTHPVAPCQTHSRLMHALLEAHGLEPRAIALHSADLRGSHGILEVDVGTESPIVVDSHYGIIYRHPDGRFPSLADLRDDPELAARNQLGATKFHNLKGKEAIPFAYPTGEDGYTFAFPAYCNYRDFGPLRWKIRDLLVSWFGESGISVPK